MSDEMMRRVEPVQHRVKPKLSRTSTEKTRTGCVTCKRRHVKCDESKPFCNNCLKSRGHCEGYSTRLRQPVPKPGQLCWDSREAAASPTLGQQLNPYRHHSQDLRGARYFNEFVELSRGPWNTAASNGDLWRVTVPQLAHCNPILYNAAMAIGALSTWHSLSKSKSLCLSTIKAAPDNAEATHYANAVDYYCKSLKLQCQQGSIHHAIFLSLLLIIFETLRDNRRAALDHVNHGLTLMFSLLTDQAADIQGTPFAPNPKALLGETADIFTQLAGQSRAMLHGRVGDGPALPNLTKELKKKRQTMESFMTFLSELPRSAVATGKIPAVFSSLDEFEEYWVASRRGLIIMSSIIVEVVKATGSLATTNDKLIDNFYQELVRNPRIKEFCERSRNLLYEIEMAFRPLFNKLILEGSDSPNYLKAIHLKLQLLGVRLFENPEHFVDAEALQTRTPEFREYLSLASTTLRIAKHRISNPAHQLSLQCGLSWSLLIVSFFCRDPVVRDEATWMLRDYPGQDGLWNTRCLHALAVKNHAVENLNAMEGSPAEQWKRLLRREFVFEDGGGRILLRYLEKNAVTKVWDLVEEAANVQGEAEVCWKRQPLTGAGSLLMAELYS
ncbi:hypothetical protein BX600DRAFT_457441 [Xylariales sp. PMI_506]|nr:hypothetical protein BX600DRAFT_457441 [Xylariales sp. PMI_506]